ncbi:hypothetical protein BV911_16035 [Pseudoruegeria sp. SK021]|nr:hypothetical protein BV911_16035 [Pseudoruegeria sp. SK021]
MTKTTIAALPDPSGFSPDPLTEILRSGARTLIQQAVEAELAELLRAHAGETTEDGRARLVRHGHLPEREVMTGIGPVAVKGPRVRDRGSEAEKIRFTSSILPPYLRKAKSIEELLPWRRAGDASTGCLAFPPQPQRHFHGRSPRGLSRLTWSERGRVVFDDNLTAQGRLVGGV